MENETATAERGDGVQVDCERLPGMEDKVTSKASDTSGQSSRSSLLELEHELYVLMSKLLLNLGNKKDADHFQRLATEIKVLF